jgi:mannose-6-phosphate isomerase-like protein (cupin superfamily)
VPHIWFLHDLVRVYADEEHTVLEMVAPPGDQPPLHVHHDSEEGFYLLEGEVTFWAGEEERRIGPGEFVLGPKGVPHSYRIEGERPARFIVTSSTGAFAAFVQAYGVPAERPELPTGVVPDVERLGRLAAEHGIELLGPPGMLPSELSAAAR